MDEDEVVIFAPNGIPVGGTEFNLINDAYEEWRLDNDQEDMGLSEYAAKIFFGGCNPTIDDVKDEEACVESSAPVARSMYPDLSSETSSPGLRDVPEAVLVDLGEASSVTTVEGLSMSSSDSMSVLDHVSVPVNCELLGLGNAHTASGETVALPVLQNSADSSGLPVLERFDVAGSGKAATLNQGLNNPVAHQTIDSEMPGLRKLNSEIPGPRNIDSEMPGLRNIDSEMPGLRKLDSEMPGLRKLDSEMPGPRKLNSEMPGLRKIDSEMPGLRKIDSEMPGLRNIDSEMPGRRKMRRSVAGKKVSTVGMPALRRISAPVAARVEKRVYSDVPVLARLGRGAASTCSDKRFLSEADISRVVESIRGLALTNDVSPVTSSDIGEDSLAKHFALLRDEYSRNAATFENVACASDSGMLSLTAEMRGVLAGIDSDDTACACAAARVHLDAYRVSFSASKLLRPTAAMRALTDSVDAYGPERVRAILISTLGKSKTFTVAKSRHKVWADKHLKNFSEAWGVLVARALPNRAPRSLTPGIAWRNTYRVFDATLGRITDLSVVSEKNIRSRVALGLWAAMAIVTMRFGTHLLSRVQTGALPWVKRLIKEIKFVEDTFLGSKKDALSNVGAKTSDSLTSSQEKVKKGFNMIFNRSMEEAEDLRDGMAVGILEAGLLTPFAQRRVASPAEREAYTQDTAAIFVTAAAGLLLANKISQAIVVGDFDRTGVMRTERILPGFQFVRGKLEEGIVGLA